MYIDSEWLDAASSKRIDCIDPASEKVFDTIPAAGAAEVDRAVKAARAAFSGPWRATTGKQRAAILRDIAEGIRGVIQAPWGGVKKSGMGRELGRWGLENFLEPKQKTRWLTGGSLGWYDIGTAAAQ